jgi:hypothetical protein
MLPEVHEHVDDRISNHAWRGQIVPVVSISPQRTPAPHRAVDGQSDSGREALHAASERLALGSLHDQVHMVTLHAEVQDEEGTAARDPGEAGADRGEWNLRPQIRRAGGAERDVSRMPGIVRRPLRSRNQALAAGARLAPCAGTPTAPCREGQAELMGITNATHTS